MIKRKVSILLILSLLLGSLFGCAKINEVTNIFVKKNESTQTTETTKKDDDSYYSIIQGKISEKSNKYLESHIKYPKIVRSTGIVDNLVDPINDDITIEINEVVAKFENTADTTFQTYLKSSVENIEKDKENKLEALKIKYKNIIGSDEVKALNDARNSNNENKNNEKCEINATESIIIGFSTTEDLVNQGPHNKKIIVVETTNKEDEIKQTTTIVDGQAPGKFVPTDNSRYFDSGDKPEFDKKRKASISFPDRADFKDKDKNFNKPIFERPTETTKIEIETTASLNETNNKVLESENITKDIVKAEVGAEIIDSDLTLDAFYKELDEIKKIRIPSEKELTDSYLKTFIDCSYQIMCLDEEYISLYIDIAAYRAGNLVNEKRIFKNIDIKKNKLVTLKDVLGENYKEKCVTTIKSKIDTLEDDFKKLLKTNYDLEKIITEDTPFFVNNNHLPVIALERNQLTIGPVGYISIVIK